MKFVKRNYRKAILFLLTVVCLLAVIDYPSVYASGQPNVNPDPCGPCGTNTDPQSHTQCSESGCSKNLCDTHSHCSESNCSKTPPCADCNSSHCPIAYAHKECVCAGYCDDCKKLSCICCDECGTTDGTHTPCQQVQGCPENDCFDHSHCSQCHDVISNGTIHVCGGGQGCNGCGTTDGTHVECGTGGCTNNLCECGSSNHCSGPCNKANTNHGRCNFTGCGDYTCDPYHESNHRYCSNPNCNKAGGDCPPKCSGGPNGYCSKLECEPGWSHVHQACGRCKECEECDCTDPNGDGDDNEPHSHSWEEISETVNKGKVTVSKVSNTPIYVSKDKLVALAASSESCTGGSVFNVSIQNGSIVNKFRCSCGMTKQESTELRYETSWSEKWISNTEREDLSLFASVGTSSATCLIKVRPSTSGYQGEEYYATGSGTKTICVYDFYLRGDSNLDGFIDADDDIQLSDGTYFQKDEPIVISNEGDKNNNNIPDYADMGKFEDEAFSLHHFSVAGLQNSSAGHKVSFKYSLAELHDPAQPNYTLPKNGHIRLWKKSSLEDRTEADLIKPEKEDDQGNIVEGLYSLSDFEFDENGVCKLYVENIGFDHVLRIDSYIYFADKSDNGLIDYHLGNEDDDDLFSHVSVEKYLVVHDKKFEAEYCQSPNVKQAEVMSNKLTLLLHRMDATLKLFKGDTELMDATGPSNQAPRWFDTTVGSSTFGFAKTDPSGNVYINGTMVDVGNGDEFSVRVYHNSTELAKVPVTVKSLISNFVIENDGDQIDGAGWEKQDDFEILNGQKFDPLNSVFDTYADAPGGDDVMEWLGMEIEYDLEDDCDYGLEENQVAGILGLRNENSPPASGDRPGDCIPYVLRSKLSASPNYTGGIPCLMKDDGHEIKMEGFNIGTAGTAISPEFVDNVAFDFDINKTNEAFLNSDESVFPRYLVREGKYYLDFGVCPKGHAEQKHLIEVNFEVKYQLDKEWVK